MNYESNIITQNYWFNYHSSSLPTGSVPSVSRPPCSSEVSSLSSTPSVSWPLGSSELSSVSLSVASVSSATRGPHLLPLKVITGITLLGPASGDLVLGENVAKLCFLFLWRRDLLMGGRSGAGTIEWSGPCREEPAGCQGQVQALLGGVDQVEGQRRVRKVGPCEGEC